MWRIINFLMGFIIGLVLGASAIMLTTPGSGQEIKDLFEKEFKARKTELEAQFFRVNANQKTT